MELLSLEGTEPMMDTIGHHCSGKHWRYSSKSATSPGCLEGYIELDRGWDRTHLIRLGVWMLISRVPSSDGAAEKRPSA